MPMQFLSMNNTGGTEIPYERRTSATYMTGLALNPQDSTRLRRYEEHWRFYTGIHWSFRREDGEPLVTANYCRAVVNKKASFLVGKGVTLQVPEPLAEITKPVLEEVWKYNNKMRLLLEFAITGGVTGDVFALVTYEPPPAARLMINPYTQGRIRIRLLGSHQVFPKWNPLNREALEFVRIITEVKDNTPPSAVEQASPVRPPYQRQSTQAGAVGVNRPRRYVEDIYPDRIVEGWDGEGMPTVRPNELGEIPLIHMINEPCPGEYFGMSDLDGIIDIQREFNEKMTDISDIINYHSAPITIITGARAKQLEKGPKAMWAGLPAEAKVFNLELGGDLGASHKYLEFVRQVMFDLSGLPEGSLGRIQPISNTSAAALQVQFQPLIETTERKAPGYERGIEEINYYILRYWQLLTKQMFPIDLCFAAETPVRVRSGWKRIEEIEAGEEVLTHLGNWKPVKTPITSARNGRRAYWIRSAGDPENVLVTEGHPYLVLRRAALEEYKDGPVRWEMLQRRSVSQEWAAVETLQAGDYLCYPISQAVKETSLIAEEMRLLGYYASEGNTFQEKKETVHCGKKAYVVGVRWSINADEQYIVEDITRCLAVGGYNKLSVKKDKRRHALLLTCYDVRLAKLCTQHAGRLSAHFCLSTELLEAPVELQREFIGAYLNGDGSQNKNNGITRFATASGLLASHLQLMLLRSGIFASLHIEHRVDGNGPYYYGNVSRRDSNKLTDVSKCQEVESKIDSRNYRIIDNMLYRRVLSVEEELEPPEVFYNLSVEDDESYVVGFAAVHNCNSCGGRIVTTRMRGKNGRVVEKKACYLVDPQTLEFMNPEQVEIMWKRRFSYGIESRRIPFGQVKAENLLEAASYWDPQPVVDLQAKAEEDKARAKELEHHIAEQDSMQMQPEQVFNEMTAQWETPEGPPKREPPSEELEPPIEVKPERLPPHDMDIPEEPEEVDVTVYVWNADAKSFEAENLGKMLLVPTGCHRPTYLSPYETTVTMKSALPRDKEKEANLYAVYQKNQWMSRRWCQTHLDEDVQPSVEDKQIADDIPFILAAQGLPDASQVQGVPGVQGDFGVGTNNGAPLPPGAGPGRGNKVVPGDNMASPKPSANAVPGQRV